jgi:hypothetical protein
MNIGSRVVWFFMFAVLSLFAAWTTFEAYRACTSKYWPTTNGSVIAFYGKPDYQYSVAGKTHVASDVSCNEFLNYLQWVDHSSKYAVKYPLNSQVTVHYCPSKPALAVLETQFDSRAWIAVVILVGMTGVCAAGFIFGWPLRRRRFWWLDRWKGEDGGGLWRPSG